MVKDIVKRVEDSMRGKIYQVESHYSRSDKWCCLKAYFDMDNGDVVYEVISDESCFYFEKFYDAFKKYQECLKE